MRNNQKTKKLTHFTPHHPKHNTIDNDKVELPNVVYQCERCDQKFKRRFHLVRHVRVKHEDTKAESHKCHDCGKSFTRTEDLKRHKAVHEIDNGVKCDNCDSTFSEKSSLKRHKKGAFGKNHFARFVCEDCAKFFCTGKALKGHDCDKILLADKSDTPIACKTCYEDFTSIRALEVHVKNSIRCFANNAQRLLNSAI